MISQELEHALDMIQKPQTNVQLSCLYGLSYMTEEGRERFMEVWERIDSPQKCNILRGLIEITEASFLVDFSPIFRLCLADKDSAVRVVGIEGLWEDHDWSLADGIIRLMQNDPASEVRAAAAAALGDFVLQGELEDRARRKAAKVRAALFQVVELVDESADVRRRALESLAYASDDRVTPLIEAAYANQDANMRTSALLAMGRTADPRWAPILLVELRSTDPERRYEAARACGELELAEAVPVLGRLVRDPDREVHVTAIWALGQIGGAEARRTLEGCYVRGDEDICEAVDEALANLILIEESFSQAYHELVDEDIESLEDLEERNDHRRGKHTDDS